MAERKPIVDMYSTGFTLEPTRTLGQCERRWNHESIKPGSFDVMLATQIGHAIEGQRDVVNVLDLGSEDGELFYNVLEDSDYGSEIRLSRDLLTQNPGLNVRMIGLTDALTHQDFLRSEPILTPLAEGKPASTQLSAETVYYSIARTQTLREFLEAIGANKVDLIISTAFFLHLETGVFEQVLTDAVRSLRSGGGMMVAHEYTSVVSIPPTQRQREVMSKAVRNMIPPTPEERKVLEGYLAVSQKPGVIKKDRIAREGVIKKLAQNTRNSAEIKFDPRIIVVRKK